MTPDFAIQIEDPRWQEAGLADEATLAAVLTAALAGAKLQEEPGEICLVFTDDASIRALNREWRGKDSPTNVLSFPAEDDGFPDEDPVLGDIVLAWETIGREAAEQRKSLDDHLKHLIVHGFLHLLGYDHQEDEEAGQMESLERKILSGLGVADPYATADATDGCLESGT